VLPLFAPYSPEWHDLSNFSSQKFKKAKILFAASSGERLLVSIVNSGFFGAS
jgi:hypothetical protein